MGKERETRYLLGSAEFRFRNTRIIEIVSFMFSKSLQVLQSHCGIRLPIVVFTLAVYATLSGIEMK